MAIAGSAPATSSPAGKTSKIRVKKPAAAKSPMKKKAAAGSSATQVKSTTSRPKLVELILEILRSNKNRKGSSRQYIAKSLEEKGVDAKAHHKKIKSALAQGVEDKKFIQVKASFKLNPEYKSQKKRAAPAKDAENKKPAAPTSVSSIKSPKPKVSKTAGVKAGPKVTKRPTKSSPKKVAKKPTEGVTKKPKAVTAVKKADGAAKTVALKKTVVAKKVSKPKAAKPASAPKTTVKA